MRPTMTCVELAELLSDYYSDALDARTTTYVRWHLLQCRGCRRQLAQLRTTVAMVGRIDVPDIDPQLRERLLAVFRDWR